MKKLLLALEIFVLTFLLQASSCTDEAIKKATNDGTKALVETKVTPIIKDFLYMQVGSSNTIEGKIDLSNAGMGDVFHIGIGTMTTNIIFKFDIPIKASFPISLNFPQSIGIAIIVMAISSILPSLLIVIAGFIWFITWLKRKKK